MSTYLICGIDEVGRGALAGPLLAVAALFEIPYGMFLETEFTPIRGVNDSKALTETKRNEVFHRILRSEILVDFGIGEVSAKDIDNIGIEKANKIAFAKALMDLPMEPKGIIIDGVNKIDHAKMEQLVVPKADSLYWPVGAASILAKVIRDNFMKELAREYPMYGWDTNSGYGTKSHIEAVKNFKSCEWHRHAFLKS